MAARWRLCASTLARRVRGDSLPFPRPGATERHGGAGGQSVVEDQELGYRERLRTLEVGADRELAEPLGETAAKASGDETDGSLFFSHLQELREGDRRGSNQRPSLEPQSADSCF